MADFFQKIRDRLAGSRLEILLTLMMIFAAVLLARLFYLQIIRGAYYQNNYKLRVEKTQLKDASRGNIYDRNGNLLAYNKLAYAVTIEDTASYKNAAEKNRTLNEKLAEIIEKLKANKDHIKNDFSIFIDGSGEYQFSVEGSALQRFRADIYGRSNVNDLTYNKKLGYDESQATANQIMDYLIQKRFSIDLNRYDKETAYEIAILRFEMSLNSYQKYIATEIATNVSDKTAAYIKENAKSLPGVDIKETTVRNYADAEAFSSVIGYTGTISTEEFNRKSAEDKTVAITDQVGKAGLEQSMDEQLTGKKGTKTVYVDNVGTPLQVGASKDPVAGNDVYLSIDKDLQVKTYKLLEQEVAGVILTKMSNTKKTSTDPNAGNYADKILPVYDIYIQLVNNHMIDVDKLNAEGASDLERAVAVKFDDHLRQSLDRLKSQLQSDSGLAYRSLGDEGQDYATYIVKKLKADAVFNADKIDNKDQMQLRWANQDLSVNDYLKYALKKNWIDISKIPGLSKYLDTDQAYQGLIEYILGNLQADQDFAALSRRYTILNDEVSPNALCAILYDQGVLPRDDSTRNALASGSLSAYGFIQSKLRSLEVRPGQLGLNLSTASAVVTDPRTGEILACVSYPGYDSNQLANATDSSYYKKLTQSSSRPLFNYATQQKTAPGSTFKPVTTVAGISEGVITASTTIRDEGVFTKVSNHPKCWSYPAFTHGTLNAQEAIRHSCNYFFYEVGYRLACKSGGAYNDGAGINLIQKYAQMFALDQKTGVEIPEAESSIATQYPVMAAIGQSDNNMTTVALARYATAVTNNGTVYQMTLLDHVSDSNGNVIQKYSPTVKSQITAVSSDTWNFIHVGMREVVTDMSTMRNFSVPIAGKTGTAQSSTSTASHGLFIGFAPYDNPTVCLAVRIPYAYESFYAADVSRDIIGCYLGDAASNALVGTGAIQAGSSGHGD